MNLLIGAAAVVILIIGGLKGYGGRTFFGVALLLLLGCFVQGGSSFLGGAFWLLVLVGGAVLFLYPPVRQKVLSTFLMKYVSKKLPPMSKAEKEALDAGTLWWEKDLLSGKPDWESFEKLPYVPLSAEESVFLSDKVDTLCDLMDQWQSNQDREIPAPVWAYIKQEKFFGLILPKENGGLGFSAYAHSKIVSKIATRSVALAVVVMVPNSLGPGELLVHYGTEEQKEKFLPRLANGAEIPCFALTEEGAGSDASSISSYGIVREGTYQGEKVLGIDLTFSKRYITLAPVATLVGLAFQLFDPEGLLSHNEGQGQDPKLKGQEGEKQNSVGITCALLPSDIEGLEIGQRHDPMGIPFPNGPLKGENVFIPLEFVIGGRAMVGKGWAMLMESLATGRSISLPALSVGALQVSSLTSTAYSLVREQFRLPIAKFEGVEEAFVPILGQTYISKAVRRVTCAALDQGEKPSVISGIVKAYLTSFMRDSVNRGMDIRAGAEICKGPSTILNSAYMAIPIGITVEGANILTRSFIIYGQGALRAHPYLLKEVGAIEEKDLPSFDLAIWGHLSFVFQNFCRALCFGVTKGLFSSTSFRKGERHYAQQINRFSAVLAFLSDLALLRLGGALKRKERLSGRFADVLAFLFMASAVLKDYKERGRPVEEWVYVRWSLRFTLFKAEQSLKDILDNFPLFGRSVLKVLLFPFWAKAKAPSDVLEHELAQTTFQDLSLRKRLIGDVFISEREVQEKKGLSFLEATFESAAGLSTVSKAFKKFRKEAGLGIDEQAYEQAIEKGILSSEEAESLKELERHRQLLYKVSAFDPEDYKNLKA